MEIKEIIALVLDIDESVVTLESTFETLQADSLDMMEISMAIEDEFDLDETVVLNKNLSVKEIINIVNNS